MLNSTVSEMIKAHLSHPCIIPINSFPPRALTLFVRIQGYDGLFQSQQVLNGTSLSPSYNCADKNSLMHKSLLTILNIDDLPVELTCSFEDSP